MGSRKSGQTYTFISLPNAIGGGPENENLYQSAA